MKYVHVLVQPPPTIRLENTSHLVKLKLRPHYRVMPQLPLSPASVVLSVALIVTILST